MKTKTINKVLGKKIDELSQSITDSRVAQIVKEKAIITGGCIASMLQKEIVNDFDIYFRDSDSAMAVGEYYLNKYKKENSGYSGELRLTEDQIKIVLKSSPGVSNPNAVEEIDNVIASDVCDDISKEYKVVFLSGNAITLTGKVQIILRFFGEPEKIHENYDFVHCRNYWTAWDRHVVLKLEALESIITKELRYVGSKYPICSLIRTRKFVSRGWSINAAQFLKMCMQVSKLDLENIDVLEDQLVGVDTTYFMNVIGQLKEKGQEKVDQNYLMTILDRIF